MGIEIKDYYRFFDKFKGLMFKKNFNYGIRLRCNGIHTFFMREKINVILTDKNQKILKIYYGVKPWRVIFPMKGVFYTYELPFNFKINLKINDKIPFNL